MSFGSRLRARREELGLKQSELGVLLGVTGSAVGNYENGVSSPKADILYRVFDVLKCDANYLFQDEMQELQTEHYSAAEIKMIKKYRALDEHGTDMVDIVLDREYARCFALRDIEESTTLSRVIPFPQLPASAGAGYFLDGSDVETLEIPATEEYRQVDFAVRVSGDSMVPLYHDGDIVLVRQQPAVEVGEIGVFSVDNSGYIKEQGADRLISLNPDYDDIYINAEASVRCFGRVLGKLE